MYKLHKVSAKPTYNQIPQTSGIQFAYVNRVSDEEGHEVFKPILCRDFLVDVQYALETNSPQGIYGFNFDPAKQTIDTDKTRLAVYFAKEESLQYFVKNFQAILNIEEQNKIAPSSYITIDNKTILLEGDPYWQSRAYLLSFYTALCRYVAMDIDISKDIIHQIAARQNSTDGSHIRTYGVKDKLSNFVKDIRLMDKYNYGVIGQKNNYISYVHNYSGILSCLYTKDHNKYADHMIKEYS